MDVGHADEAQDDDSIETTPEAASYFLDAEWQLVSFRGHPLLTSDEPIVLGRETHPAPFALGLQNADFMLFPLPRVAA